MSGRPTDQLEQALFDDANDPQLPDRTVFQIEPELERRAYDESDQARDARAEQAFEVRYGVKTGPIADND